MSWQRRLEQSYILLYGSVLICLSVREHLKNMESYPKTSKFASERSGRPRKRKFHGNQFLNVSSSDDGEANTSRSEQKLSSATTEDVIVHPSHCYRIIEFVSVFLAISQLVICNSCKQRITFAESSHRGLGFKIILSCRCGKREIQSGPLIHTGYEINRRIVFVMRLLGVAREGINIFCGLMDLSQGIGLAKSTYDKIVEHLHTASKTMFESACKSAVEEEKQLNVQNERPADHLKVSGDGSWKKRGFTSLYGVAALIGYYSGKVIDLDVKSGYCHTCTLKKNTLNDDEYEEWYETHKESCSSNHAGSAGKMEVDSITEMFSRSIEKLGVMYSNYIGDGDSKTFLGIVNNNPYGDKCIVTKNECVGHVQKRMGTRLRNKRKEQKLGGKKRLTETVIKKLTMYYGLAIRRNLNSVEGMRSAIIATLDHYCSTDQLPRHNNCPKGAESWCEWRKAEAKNTLADFKHPPRLIDDDIEKHIRPIYEELSKDDLLKRCLGGHTQNANESFNSTVWRMTPKHLHSGIKIVEIAAFIAGGMFNEGYSAVLKTMHLLGLKIGLQCNSFCNKADEDRITRQNRRASLATKEARTARRMEQLAENQFCEESEEQLYGAGIAD